MINGLTCSFYINGVSAGGGTVTIPIPETASQIGIGATRTGLAVGTTGQDLAGDISIVQIYNRALSTEEIKQNFQATRGRYGL